MVSGGMGTCTIRWTWLLMVQNVSTCTRQNSSYAPHAFRGIGAVLGAGIGGRQKSLHFLLNPPRQVRQIHGAIQGRAAIGGAIGTGGNRDGASFGKPAVPDQSLCVPASDSLPPPTGRGDRNDAGALPRVPGTSDGLSPGFNPCSGASATRAATIGWSSTHRWSRARGRGSRAYGPRRRGMPVRGR